MKTEKTCLEEPTRRYNICKLAFTLSFMLLISPSLLSQEETHNLEVDLWSLSANYRSNSEKIKKKEFAKILHSDTEAYELYKQGNRKVVTGNIVLIPSLLLIASMDWENLEKNPPYTFQWIGGFAGCLATILLYSSGNKDFQEAAKIYNNKNLSLNFNINNNGLGIVMVF